MPVIVLMRGNRYHNNCMKELRNYSKVDLKAKVAAISRKPEYFEAPLCSPKTLKP